MFVYNMLRRLIALGFGCLALTGALRGLITMLPLFESQLLTIEGTAGFRSLNPSWDLQANRSEPPSGVFGFFDVTGDGGVQQSFTINYKTVDGEREVKTLQALTNKTVAVKYCPKSMFYLHNRIYSISTNNAQVYGYEFIRTHGTDGFTSDRGSCRIAAAR